MPIVPTQLLEFADGLTTRGWSTMYDMQVLSIYKVIEATHTPTAEELQRTGLFFKKDAIHTTVGDYSPLLVQGKVTA